MRPNCFRPHVLMKYFAFFTIIAKNNLSGGKLDMKHLSSLTNRQFLILDEINEGQTLLDKVRCYLIGDLRISLLSLKQYHILIYDYILRIVKNSTFNILTPISN
jgi:hypothetical protein